MEEIKLNRLIETFYFTLYRNNKPIDVIEFNHAFATNEYYDSNMPIARHGLSDIFIKNDHIYDVNYSSDFLNNIIKMDRDLVTDRVAYFSMMRAALPTFYLVTNDDKEIKVECFATMSENGYCSISYVYTGIEEFEEKLHTEILRWNNFKCIKMDLNLRDILNIKDEIDNNARFVGYEIKELLSTMSEGSIFGLGIEALITILKKFFEKNSIKNNSISYNHMQNAYRYYQFETTANDNKKVLDEIRKITQELPLEYHINDFLCDMGKDITQYEGIYTYGYENMLIEIRKVNKYEYESIEIFYSLFDYFLFEREKLVSYIHKYKNKKYDVDYDEGELIEDNNYIWNKINNDLIYDFYKERYYTAKAVYECLNIERYITELEKIQQRIENTVIRKERFKKEKENHKFNMRIQLISLLFSIPVVCDIVEIFYANDMPKWITFPKSCAKILWIILTIIGIKLLFDGVKNQNKDKK